MEEEVLLLTQQLFLQGALIQIPAASVAKKTQDEKQ